jgi:integrase
MLETPLTATKPADMEQVMSIQNGSDRYTSEQAATYKAANADFPLRWHPRGGWCKKIKGGVTYWGRVTLDEALKLYHHQREFLERGEVPPAYDSDAITLHELCNEFLASKEAKVESGELSQRSWNDYKRSCDHVLNHFGRNRAVANLRPMDFQRFRSYLSKGRGLVALSHEITRTRGLLKFAHKMGLMESSVRYGDEFDKPSKGKLRTIRNEAGRQDFTPEEAVKILDATEGQLNAMVLLGLNSALGNSNLTRLDCKHLDLVGGWLSYARGKTGAARRSKLWPETIAALTPYVDGRKEGRVFTTKYLNPWSASAITHEFRKVLVALEMTKTQRNFYGLRRTWRTIADEVHDSGAADLVMGHISDATMGSHYVQSIGDDRLQAVSNHVRKRVLIDGKPKRQRKASRKAVAR